MHAYYMQDPPCCQTDPCRLEPNQPISQEKMAKAGVWTKQFPMENGWEKMLEEIAKANGFTYKDEVQISKETVPDFEDKIKMLFHEHFHDKAAVRFVKDGSGYFDFRDPDDRWVRIAARRGDLIYLPAGIYHRFSVDKNGFIHTIRLFTDSKTFGIYNRSEEVESIPARTNYLSVVLAD